MKSRNKEYHTGQSQMEMIKAALHNKDLSESELSNVFNKVQRSQKSWDGALLHNLGLLAARAGMMKEAAAFASDFLNSGHPGTATVIAIEALKHDKSKRDERFHAILENAANTGHFRARSKWAGLRLAQLGVFGRIILLPYRIFLAFHAALLVFRNPQDIRIDVGPLPKCTKKATNL